MGPAEAMLTGGAPVRVVMTMTMAMAMAMAMSVRRKSDVWVYWARLTEFKAVGKVMEKLLRIICKPLNCLLNLVCN